jgi:hypothetical protein
MSLTSAVEQLCQPKNFGGLAVAEWNIQIEGLTATGSDPQRKLLS